MNTSGQALSYGHYTSAAGLLGVLEQQVLWATNIKFLNDQHEFQHALNLITQIISHSKIGADDPLQPLQQFLSQIREKLDSLDNYRADTVFTFSFSEQTDLLSQWRGYCPANNGYCVVLDAHGLFEIVRKKFAECHFVKCVYDDAQKGTDLRLAVNATWHQYRKLSAKEERDHVIDAFAKQVMLFASYFKHPSFQEEQEHRIVILREYGEPYEDLKFRVGRSSLIPYLELPAPHELIREICIGPNADKQLAKRALEALLEKSFRVPYFMGDVRVSFSETPYRPW